MKVYLTVVRVAIFCTIFVPAVTFADNAAILKQLQIDLLWYSQVLTTGVLTPEKAEEVMAGLRRISAELAELLREPGIGGSSVFAPQAINRTNIKSISVYGNPATMAATVEVVYNEEEVYGQVLPAATSTIRLMPATSNYTETETGGRIDELMLYARESVLPGLAVTQEFYDNLVQYSMKQYQSKEEVKSLLQKVGKGNFPLTIGDLSIINDITIVAGQKKFTLTIKSSQNEKIVLVVKPHTRYCGDGDTCEVEGRYDFSYQYIVLGVVVDDLSRTNFSRKDLVDEILREEIFLGAGAVFTPKVTDARLVRELTDFMIGSQVYYTHPIINQLRDDSHLIAAEACHPKNVKNFFTTLLDYYLQGVQVSGPTGDILTVRAPIEYQDRNTYYTSRCEQKNSSFFPSFN